MPTHQYLSSAFKVNFAYFNFESSSTLSTDKRYNEIRVHKMVSSNTSIHSIYSIHAVSVQKIDRGRGVVSEPLQHSLTTPTITAKEFVRKRERGGPSLTTVLILTRHFIEDGCSLSGCSVLQTALYNTCSVMFQRELRV